MEPIHIFHKELPVDENNTFTADITEKNKVESVKFKKSQEYAVIGLSINQYIGSALVTVTDIDWQNFLSNSIQKLVKEKQDPDLDLKISNPETKNIIPFQKKISCWVSTNKTDILQYKDQKKWSNWVLQLFSAPSKVWFCLGTSPDWF